MIARARSTQPIVAAIAIALGCFALATRPVAWRSTGTIALVGVVGIAGAIPRALPRTSPARWAAVVALGSAAFAATRFFEVPVARPFVLAAVAAASVAAVAEEAFFRRYLYGWLERRGAALAVVGSAIAFAAVHVPIYGVHVLPIDLAAGLIFSWQRWASGSWTAPAATHVFANLLAMG